VILLDTNLVIYAASPAFPGVTRFVAENETAVSAISYVEALGFHQLAEVERDTLETFFASEPMFPLDPPVLDRAVALRQQKRMTLGDALIAATALVHDLPLATNNVRDFRDIAGLDLLNPV